MASRSSIGMTVARDQVMTGQDTVPTMYVWLHIVHSELRLLSAGKVVRIMASSFRSPV